jgi:hypothetical protein
MRQYSDDFKHISYLQGTSACPFGHILCPQLPETFAAQQTSQIQSLDHTLDRLQKHLFQLISQIEMKCNSSCPAVCPLSCTQKNPAGCPSGCPLATCYSCAAERALLSSVNASSIQVAIDRSRLQNQLPLDPVSVFSSNKSLACVASVVQCFNVTTASDAVNGIISQASFCSGIGLKYCPLLGCVSHTTSCIPLEQCPEERPKRCPFLGTIDGGSACVPAHVTCATTDIIHTVCPFNQSLCPGGLQCASGSGTSFYQVNWSLIAALCLLF